MSTVPHEYAPAARMGPAATDRPVDAWSVVSLVTGLVGLSVVGVVAGVVGIGRTAPGHRRGRGLAVAGLVVSVLVLLAQVAFVLAVGPALVEGARQGFREGVAEATAEEGGTEVADEDTGRTDVAAPAPTGDADVVPVMVDSYELDVGHCFDDPPTETFDEVATLPCDMPHDGEVVATLQLEGDRYPGDVEVEDMAWEACASEVADLFDAAGVDTSGLDLWTFTPTKESWVLDGDRDVACLAYALEGQLEAPVLP